VSIFLRFSPGLPISRSGPSGTYSICMGRPTFTTLATGALRSLGHYFLLTIRELLGSVKTSAFVVTYLVRLPTTGLLENRPICGITEGIR
jgi:hypothetical protein